MVSKFRVLPELLKKNNLKRKERSIDSKITPKRLNKQQLLELQTIKREKQQFLKEIGLIGKTKDNYLDLNKFKEYKLRLEQLSKRSKILDKHYNAKLNNLYKDGIIQSFAIGYIKKDIIPHLNNKALKKRLEKLFSSERLSGLEAYIYPKWDSKNSRFVPNEEVIKRFPNLEAHFKSGVGSWNKYSNPDYASSYGINNKMLKVIFNKYPFLKELKNIQKGKKQLEIEQKIIQLSNDLEKTNEHMKNPFEKYIRREQDVLIRANDAMYRHNPIIWDNKVNKLFKERYGITLTDIYNKFTKGYTGSRPLDITNYVLKKVLNKNTLMVFPLRGSLFNYYLTRGVIAELKRLGLAKNELNAVTITADTFKHWNSFYNMESYTYGTSYHDIAERAPDIISGQLTNILKKHKNTAQISIVDFKNTGFQKDYIYHYIKKHYNKENKNHPELDFLSVNEEQRFNFSNKETIDPTDLVKKRVDRESAGAKGYIAPINSKSTLSNITKMKEMLEIAGRMLLRSELKIRGTI